MIGLLLLGVSIFQPAMGGVVSGRATDAPASPWNGFGRPAAEGSVLQMNNNTTAPPSFAELLPVILFVLAGGGIAIVVVAAALWIARRARGGKEPKGGNPRHEGEEENGDWGAKW